MYVAEGLIKGPTQNLFGTFKNSLSRLEPSVSAVSPLGPVHPQFSALKLQPPHTCVHEYSDPSEGSEVVLHMFVLTHSS